MPVAFCIALFDRRWKGRQRAGSSWTAPLVTITAILLFLPLLQYMLSGRTISSYRVMTRAGSRERALPAPAPVVLLFEDLEEAWRSPFTGRATARGSTPSPRSRSSTPPREHCSLAGACGALALAARGSRRWALVLLSVPVLTLASTLALAFPIENPGINRAAVAFPSIVAIAALPAARLIEAARGRRLLPRVLAAVGSSASAPSRCGRTGRATSSASPRSSA